MELSFARDIVQTPDLVHRVRHLGYFRKQFGGSVETIAKRSGVAVSLDRVKLTRLFLDWHEDCLAQRAAAGIDRRDFILFSAGSMLCHLIRTDPVAAVAAPGGTAVARLSPEASDILGFWPEGFLYTSYCLSMLETVLAQEGLPPLRLDASLGDVRTWWSFRENARENPLQAIGFLDRFVGAEPNWTFPGAALARPAIARGGGGQAALH